MPHSLLTAVHILWGAYHYVVYDFHLYSTCDCALAITILSSSYHYVVHMLHLYSTCDCALAHAGGTYALVGMSCGGAAGKHVAIVGRLLRSTENYTALTVAIFI